MEQHRLRLGDILDDYCPRERRVTNHAIVAMIEEDVKQTRCTTCDTEHAYKGARVPKRRKKETPGALAAPFAHPPEAIVAIEAAPSADSISRHEPVEDRQAPMQNDNNRDGRFAADQETPAPIQNAASVENDVSDAQPATDTGPVDGPVHRPLIRATLPRPDGQKDVRPAPEFTVRHSPTRGNGQGSGSGNFRGGDRMRMRGGNPNGNGPNGNRPHNAGARFHGGSGGNRPTGPGRQSMGRGGQPGFRSGNGGPNGKRGRGSRG
jgi:hypothetical protein